MFIKLTSLTGEKYLINTLHVDRIRAIKDRDVSNIDPDYLKYAKSCVIDRLLDSDDETDEISYYRESLEQIEKLLSKVK